MNASLFEDARENALFADAELARQQQQWQQAVERALELCSRRLAQQVPLGVGDFVLLESMADLAVPLGQTQAADGLLAALVAACVRRGQHFTTDYLTLKRAHVALIAADFGRAQQLLESLSPRIGLLTDIPYTHAELPDWESACHWPPESVPGPDRALFFSRLYLSVGQWLAANGQYNHTIILLERGITHARPPASTLACRAWIPLRLALAEVFLEQGQLDDCASLLDALKEQVNDAEGPGWYVQWLELQGKQSLLRGHYGHALESLARVTGFCHRVGLPQAVLGALLNQADVLIVLNQISVAEELLEEASGLAEELGNRSAAWQITWLYHLCQVRSRSLTESLAIAPSAVEMQDRPRHSRWEQTPGAAVASPLDLAPPANFLAFFEQRVLGVQWVLGQGDMTLACQLLSDVQQTFADCDSPLIQLRLHALAGMVAYDTGDFPSAARIFAEVCPHLEERGLQPDLWPALRFRAWCAVRLHAPAEEQQELSDRAYQVMEILANSQSPAQRAIYLLNKLTPEERALRQEIHQLAALKAAVVATPWYQRWWHSWKLWGRLNHFLRRLDDNRWQLAQKELSSRPVRVAPPLSVWQRMWRPPWRSATLSFLVLPDCVFAAKTSWMTLDFVVSPLTRLRVRTLVSAWHQSIQPHMDADTTAKLATIGEELYQGLQLPELLGSLPRRVNRLTIVADDSLHGFPFAALKDSEHYLIDKYALTMAYDRAPLPKGSLPSHGEPLIVAVSTGLAGVIPGLPGTLPEMQNVKSWLKKQGIQPYVLRDAEAQKDKVLEAWSRTRFAHIACHGVFEPDRPDASGLLMISEPAGVEIISLRDLAQLDLRCVRHVTLSSCWGADSFVLPGRWIVSLPETLYRCGVESIVACLWRVHDTMGPMFFARFYDHLTTLPRDLALQKTQQEFMKMKNLAASPYHWAGYRLHGRADRLRL